MNIQTIRLLPINCFKHFISRIRKFSNATETALSNQKLKLPDYLQFTESFENASSTFKRDIINSMTVHKNFLSEVEENSILDEIEPYLKRMKYELDHWDDAIHGYRETERLKWNEANTKIIDRVREVAFPKNVEQLKYVHILDLQKDGYIKPHIDAVRFCGDTIAGLSLLTDSVMRLVHDKNKDLIVDILLERRSLYVMKNAARYDYTHEILSNEFSKFRGKFVEKDRRISVICRNAPSPDAVN